MACIAFSGLDAYTCERINMTIFVDWGSSRFRAYQADGVSIAHIASADKGILNIADRDFERVFRDELGPWLVPGTQVVLSGMITSRSGWVETGYVSTPASASSLTTGAIDRTLDGGIQLKFLPGVAEGGVRKDVMRGEEIQVFGAVDKANSATVVLPGTHSKWVEYADGRIGAFQTYLTGELYALLCAKSVLSHMRATDQVFNELSFEQGLDSSATEGGLLSQIFQARSRPLLGDLKPEAIDCFISGVLIGNELRAATASRVFNTPILLAGARELCLRYQHALCYLGVSADVAPEHCVTSGFQRLAAEMLS